MNTNKNAKRILIYGDSYTFGKIPGGARFDSETRFTGVLQKTLGKNFEIIEEGLRGRMLEGENAFFPHRNGLMQFDGIFGSHLPLDLVILFLGTNDTNSGSKKTPRQIVNGYSKYLKRVDWWCKHLDFPKPKIMIVTPPPTNEKKSYKIFNDLFKGSQSKSEKLPELLKNFVKTNKLLFFNASEIVQPSPIDGIHLAKLENKVLGEKLATKILNSVIS
jgi:lysophospholipase L1-like esterase